MILIGISGKKRSGKNTVSSMIRGMTNLSVEEYAFEDELKKEVSKICGVTVKDLETNKELYRELLQAWGCYKRKFKGEDYWVGLVFAKMIHSTADICIVTDVRFPNEAKHIEYVGGYLFRVARDTGNNDIHESEIALDSRTKWDAIIINNGTLEHLQEDIKTICQKLKIKTK